jgi:high-affinity nickel-transport protein
MNEAGGLNAMEAEAVSLIFLVFILGVRHGLDADHLAIIDAQTRYNWQMGSPIARWVGTLFSFGHGAVVAIIAVVLGMFVKNFKFPDYFDALSTWIAIISLFAIGTWNIVNLLKRRAPGEEFRIHGIKSKFLPRLMKETTNPFFIILLGGAFALAADTVSQTSMWALSASNSSGYMPVILGLVFMIGMMLTDTLDSIIAYRMISQSGKLGQSASRLMGWMIVMLAYGVSFYEAFTFFYPVVDLDFEIVGIIAFALILLCFGVVSIRAKLNPAALKSKEAGAIQPKI